MSNNIITTNKNAKQALVKSKSLIDITNKLLAKRSQQQIVENLNNLRLSISLGHEESVNNMIFTPDGNYILSASVDGTMKLWDIHSGKEVRTFEGNKRQITSLAITSDGKYVVTGGFNLEIILWNLYTGEKVREYHDEESIPCMDYQTDIQIINNKIISKHGESVIYWDINSGEVISGFGYIDAISPDRKTAVTFYDEYGIMWDIQSGEKIKTLDKGGFKSRFTPDGKYIVSKKGEVITLWDAQKGEIIRIFEESGKYAVLSDGEIILLDTEHEDDFYESVLIYALQVTPDSNYVITGNSNGILVFWDIQSGKQTKALYHDGKWVNSIAIDSSGKYMVSGGGDGTIVLWDLESYKAIRTFGMHSDSLSSNIENNIEISEQGDHIILSSYYNSTKRFDIHRGIESNKNIYKTLSENRYSVSSFDKTIQLIDIQSGEEIRSFSGHTESVEFVAITPDNNYVVSVSWTGIIKLWDLHSGREVKTIENDLKFGSYEKISITLDSRHIALSTSWNKIILRDLYNGEIVNIKNMDVYCSGSMCSGDIFFDFNSEYIVANPKASAIHLFDLKSGELLSKYATFENGREWIAWTQNGYYNCSKGAEKYICFVDDSKGMPIVIDTSHPIYKQKKKKILPNDYLSNHNKHSRRR